MKKNLISRYTWRHCLRHYFVRCGWSPHLNSFTCFCRGANCLLNCSFLNVSKFMAQFNENLVCSLDIFNDLWCKRWIKVFIKSHWYTGMNFIFFKKKANLKTIYMALSFLCLLSTSLLAALMSPVVVGSLSEDLYALVVISQATSLYSINLC